MPDLISQQKINMNKQPSCLVPLAFFMFLICTEETRKNFFPLKHNVLVPLHLFLS